MTEDEVKKTLQSIQQMHEKIQEMNKQIKEQKKKLEDSKTSTMSWMEENKISILDIGKYELAVKERVTNATINKEFIAKRLNEYFEENELDEYDHINKIVEYIWNKRKELATKKNYMSIKKAKVSTKKKKKKKEPAGAPAPKKAKTESVETVEDPGII